jgi:hypothetical protein
VVGFEEVEVEVEEGCTPKVVLEATTVVPMKAFRVRLFASLSNIV